MTLLRKCSELRPFIANLPVEFRIALPVAVAALLSGCGGGADTAAGPSGGAPTVTISANPTSVASGATSTLTWSSTNATSCTASGAWSGAEATSGSKATSALSAESTFTLTCANSTGITTVASVKVSIATSQPPPSSQPLGLYTDLSSAPVGAMVTAYGNGFGSSGSVTLAGTAQTIVSYSDTKVVFTVSGAGGALVVGGKSLGNLPVHTGRVLTADPSSVQSTWGSAQPGDVIYLHAGTYGGSYGDATWNTDANFNSSMRGTATRPIAIVGYPGETATISNSRGRPNFYLGTEKAAGAAAYLTIAELNLSAPAECIYGGGNTADSSTPESGGIYIRVVGNTCTLTDATSNTMTGAISVQGDGWQILGNTLHDPANRAVINNNHALYIQNGADNVEVAYNTLVNLHVGHVIQVHQDGDPMLYSNVWIHDNLLQSDNPANMRGINIGNVASASTFTIEHNTLRNVGQNFSGVSIYGGVVTVRNNLFYAILAPDIDLNGMSEGTQNVTRTVTVAGNRLETTGGYPAVQVENGASASEITLTGNSYCSGLALTIGDTNLGVCL